MFNFIPPVPKAVMNKYADGTPSRKATQFPPNLAATLPKETQKQILMWMSANYLWPQIQERVPFEGMWDKLLQMSRIQMPAAEALDANADDTRLAQIKETSGTNKMRVSDSVVHDAIERLTDITHFVSFKEGLPIQFNVPKFVTTPMQTPEYRPLETRIKAGNAILDWNSANAQVYRNHLIGTRQHYTYGVGFYVSDFQFRVEPIVRQDNNGDLVQVPEITKVGTTFDPLSLRKVWLNWRLPVYSMELQACPFFFEETPRFAILQNVYDAVTNPFGYANTDAAFQQDWLYTGQEMQSTARGLAIAKSVMDTFEKAGSGGMASILKPEHSVEARWTAYPMLPLDPATQTFDFDGSKKIPYQRFVVEMFGANIINGGQTFLRIQQNYYPKNMLPLYASCHMPDLDSGAYAPSIGQILWNHYREITLCMEQFLVNKDWINNPPAWIQISSPAATADLNRPGAKVKVNGPNDFGWRVPFDATASTIQMIQMLRESAQTTSKAVDAVLGKAMGGRTSATEASNAFQASMSAITTDINLYNYDVMGGYAMRVWLYTGMWFDPDLLKAITGQFGFEITPQDMWLNVGLKWDVGSSFIESIVRQQNVRYLLESGRLDPILRRDELYRQLLEDMRFDPSKLINDGGYEHQVQLATLQASETYLGEPVIISPDQDHTVAIKVKTAFIEDQDSVWNTKYPQNAQLLVGQIQQHQFFLQLQMQMMLAQQQMQVAQAQLGIAQDEQAKQPQQGSVAPGEATTQAGQVAQNASAQSAGG